MVALLHVRLLTVPILFPCRSYEAVIYGEAGPGFKWYQRARIQTSSCGSSHETELFVIIDGKIFTAVAIICDTVC